MGLNSVAVTYGNDIHEHENKTKANEPSKFALNLWQRLNLKNINKHVALQYFCIYYKRKNVRQQYKNNKIKIIAPTWNDEFELPDVLYSVSDIQDYIEYIIIKHKKFPTNFPIHIYFNRIINRIVFKIKDGYKIELKTPETMKLNKEWRKFAQVLKRFK